MCCCGVLSVQFKDEMCAKLAVQAYHGFKLSQQHTLTLMYARK